MPNGNQLARFTYNQRLELVKSVRDRGGCGPDEVHTYAYDLNHNWTKKDGVSYTNKIADQLLAVAGGGSLSYNDSGQATDVQGWDVTYNCADQITGILAPGKNIAYRYDGAGQRVEKTVNGVSQKFLWNGGDICKEYAADGSVRADYFLGAGREGIKTNGQWHWYLSDIQGSTLMLTDGSGHSAATYDYSDYGETRQTSGSTALYNPFLYTGQEYDFETSLYHLRARHYSPAKGRFFSRDPIGYAGGSNMYAYFGADPINFIDPSGLASTWFGIGPAMPASSALPNVRANKANVTANLGAGLDLFVLSAHHYAVNKGINVYGSGYFNEFVKIGDILNGLSRALWPKITALNGCWTGRSLPGGTKPQDKVIVYTDDFTNGQLNVLFQANFYKFLQQGKTVAEAINSIYQTTGNEGFHPIKGKYHFWGNGSLRL